MNIIRLAITVTALTLSLSAHSGGKNCESEGRIQYTKIDCETEKKETLPFEYRSDGTDAGITEELAEELTQSIKRHGLNIGPKLLNKEKLTETLITNETIKTQPLNSIIDTEEYFETENEKRRLEGLEFAQKIANKEMTQSEFEAYTTGILFPVTTKLSPRAMIGDMQRNGSDYKESMPQPIAVIGADEYSLNWYRMNVNELRRLNSVVVLTQVDTLIDFVAILKFAPDLKVTPMDAEDLLREHGIDMYPVLIMQSGIYQ